MIDTAALREKVLDLAIRGKLVPQDPNDEPASVLLERIRAQKLQMVKEGKLKAKDIKDDTIIFKGDDNCHYEKFADGTIKNIQEEIPFDLPNGWAITSLGSICTMQAGKSIPSAQISLHNFDSAYPCYGGNGARGFVSTYTYEGHYPLIGRQGALCGNVCLATGKFYATEHAVVVQPLEEINIDWLYYELIGLNLNQYAKGAAQPGLAVSNIVQIKILLPPIEEQKRIVETISSIISIIDGLENNKKELYEIKELVKSKILELAIQGKLVKQDDSDEPASVLLERIRAEKKAQLGKKYVESYIYKGDDNCYYEKVGSKTQEISDKITFNLPERWCWITLKEIATITSGKTPKPEQLSSMGTVPYFKVGDMNLSGNELFMNKAYSYVNEHYDGIMFPENSIIFPKNGGALLTNKKRILSTTSLVDLNTGVLIPSKLVNSEYMYYLFSTVDFSKNYKGSTIPTIDNDIIGNHIFGLPPIQEQLRIVKKIKLLIQIIEKSLI